MHYENKAFSMNGKDTIVANDDTPLIEIWKKTDLTNTDVEEIQRYYGCID
jgi:hypothetical protein